MLITDEYKSLNEKLHETNKHYGTSGHKWANQVQSFVKLMDSHGVLDYGCGKSTLAQNLPFAIKQYDPAVEKYAALPEPADLVVCTDVLEHIEPDCIDDVIEHILSVTKQMAFLVIANRPAQKILEDGRNAHLIQQNDIWWLAKLLPKFHLLQFASSFLSASAMESNMLEYVLILSPRYDLKE